MVYFLQNLDMPFGGFLVKTYCSRHSTMFSFNSLQLLTSRLSFNTKKYWCYDFNNVAISGDGCGQSAIDEEVCSKKCSKLLSHTLLNNDCNLRTIFMIFS